MDSSLILSSLGNIAVRAAGLFLLASFVLFAFRVRSSATRHAVWTLVAGAMLLFPVLRSAAPKVPLRVLQAPPAISYSLPATPVPTVPVQAKPALRWEDAVVGVWMAGALLLLGRLAYGYGFALRLVKAAREVEEGVSESDWIAVPVTIGSRIVLPADWRTWSAEKRAAVLAHETAHVQRHDWAISAMAALNRAIFWFHPAAWWLERTLASLAEQACDDVAVAKVGSREAYAAALVEIAAAVKAGAGRVVWEAMAMARSGAVRTRVERILNEACELSGGVSRRRWRAMALGALPLLWLASAVHLARVQAAPPPMSVASEVADQEPVVSSDARAAALEKVRKLETEIANFKSQYMGRMPEQFQANLEQMGSLQARLGNMNEQMDALQRLKLLEQRIAEAQGAMESARETFTPSHPRISQLESTLANLRSQLAAAHEESARPDGSVRQSTQEAEAAINRLNTEIQNINIEMDEKVKLIQDMQRQLESLNSRVRSSSELDRYLELQHEYQMAKEELENASTTGPALLLRVEPEYTAAARSAGIQGKVELSVTIGTDGIARDIQVIRSLDAGLDRQAIESVAKWRFRPAMRGGHAVTAFATVEVNFKL
jgi:TonB family protein